MDEGVKVESRITFAADTVKASVIKCRVYILGVNNKDEYGSQKNCQGRGCGGVLLHCRDGGESGTAVSNGRPGAGGFSSLRILYVWSHGWHGRRDRYAWSGA